MADRMTPEQVATLRLPKGCHMALDGMAVWWWNWDEGATRTDGVRSLMHVACMVANGHLPPTLLDWALAHVDGKAVPTVAQWEAALEMASRVDHDDRYYNLCRRVYGELKPTAPPSPAPAPPIVDVFAGSRLRGAPKPKPKPAKRTCGECRFFRGECRHPDSLFGVAPKGMTDTFAQKPSPDRDATLCERWEPKS